MAVESVSKANELVMNINNVEESKSQRALTRRLQVENGRYVCILIIIWYLMADGPVTDSIVRTKGLYSIAFIQVHSTVCRYSIINVFKFQRHFHE